jgi:RNA polymerase sigma-70 factor (ECF subfamily)
MYQNNNDAYQKRALTFSLLFSKYLKIIAVGKWHGLCHLPCMTDHEYNECVQLHADGLYRFILKNTRHRDDARDIVQSAFEKMWRNRESVDNKTGKAFLFKVAYHEMIDQYRKKKIKVQLEEVPLYQPVTDHKKLLEHALSRLSETQRMLVLLKDQQGYSYEEISVITGLSVVQVKVYLHRSRLQLKSYLGRLENILEQ